VVFSASAAPINSRRYSVNVDGVNVTSLVSLEYPFSISDTAGQPAQMEYTILDKNGTFALQDGAVVNVTNLVTGQLIFYGNTMNIRRRRGEGGHGRLYTCTALGWEHWLDRRFVPQWSSDTITTDRGMVQSIITRFAGMVFAPNATVDETATGMSKINRRGVTVREVLEAIAEEASTKADPTPRRFYVSPDRKLHWYKGNENLPAPYRITDGYYTTVTRATSGLVSLWSFAEPTGATAYDAQGYANATLAGGYTRGVTAGVVNEPQKTAVTLNGSTAYASATGANLHPGNTFSLELWFKRDTLGVTQSLLSGGTDDFLLYFSAGNTLVLSKDGTGTHFASTATFTDTAWHHLVVSRTAGNNAVVYVDGVALAGTWTARTFTAAAGTVEIGRRKSTGTEYFDGSLQHVAIYSTAMSAANALAHYQQGAAIEAEHLEVERDISELVQAVYIKGATATVSNWVFSGEELPGGFRVDDYIDRPNVTTATQRENVGEAYLARRKRAQIGVTFSVTGYDGWAVGQVAIVTDSAAGLSGTELEIKDVRINPNRGNGVMTYDISAGLLRPSGVRDTARKRR
jgi:hypothetical protein